MNLHELRQWLQETYGPALTQMGKQVETSLDLFSGSSCEEHFLIDYFEPAINSADLFGRVKLVHVARMTDGAGRRARRHWATLRREALLKILRGAQGFDPRPLERMYEAVLRHELDAFYPVASVEYSLATGKLEEVSLYSEEDPVDLGKAMAEAVGASPRELETSLEPDRLFAIGYDFRYGRPARLKLYHRYPLNPRNLQAYESGLPFLAAPKTLLPHDFLVLRRKAEGEAFEDTRKVYLCYLSRKARGTSPTVSAMAEACAPGILKDFLGRIQKACQGQYVDYLGCEGRRFEIYFGKPAWAGARVSSLALAEHAQWKLP